MNFYKRHIGDYIKDTAHLSLLEHGIYCRLIDVYYSRESAIPDDQAARLIGVRTGAERAALNAVLSEFFSNIDGFWYNSRCDKEIAMAQTKAETNRAIGKLGGRPKKQTEKDNSENPEITQTVSVSNPEITLASNHKPVTSNHKPEDQDQNILVASKPATSPCPHQEIIDAYHELCPTLSGIREWPEHRRKLLQARWREDSKRQSLDWWRKFFAYVNQSDFLRGADGTWQADLEWLIRPTNFVKVIEGKYHNRGAA